MPVLRTFCFLSWVVVMGCGARGGLSIEPPPVDASRPDAGVDAGQDAAVAASAYDISVGPIFAALTTSDGRYLEWGVQGEVGAARLIPEVPPALRIVVGRAHRCLLDDRGRVLCWGSSEHGALGLGSRTSVEEPTEVPLPARVVDLSASTQTTCAILSSGETYCWGANRYRQLGSGEGGDETPVGTPRRVETTDQATLVTASPTHGCALLRDGEIRCWGAHRHSQLGDGTHTTSFGLDTTAPVGVGSATDIAVGLEWSCALTTESGAMCWGEPASAPHRALFVPLPITVEAPAAATLVRLGDDGHACFLGDGSVSCFAYSDADPMPTRATAAPVPGLADDVVDLDVGYWRACALHADGGVSCWGPGGRAERVAGIL